MKGKIKARGAKAKKSAKSVVKQFSGKAKAAKKAKKAVKKADKAVKTAARVVKKRAKPAKGAGAFAKKSAKAVKKTVSKAIGKAQKKLRTSKITIYIGKDGGSAGGAGEFVPAANPPIDAPNVAPYSKEISTCTMCGFCKSVCCTYEGGTWDDVSARSRIQLAYGLLQKEIGPDDSVVKAIYTCTMCGDCGRRCPSTIKVVEIITGARKDLFENGFALKEHVELADNIMRAGNPFGESGLPYEQTGEAPKKAKVAYFVDCVSAYREKRIAASVLSILKKLGVDYTVADTKCCGDALTRMGADENLVKELAEYNISKLKEQGVETLLFSCPGCYETFKKTYPKYAQFDFKLMHVSEFLAERAHSLNLGEFAKKATYHDPCHLGRGLGIYEAPRKVIAAIPKLEFKEMAFKESTAHCCGAGGGVSAAYPELTEKIAAKRIKEAKDREVIITACPLCVHTMKKAKTAANPNVEVVDIAEVVDRLLQ